jgi:hypothetical protein
MNQNQAAAWWRPNFLEHKEDKARAPVKPDDPFASLVEAAWVVVE